MIRPSRFLQLASVENRHQEYLLPCKVIFDSGFTREVRCLACVDHHGIYPVVSTALVVEAGGNQPNRARTWNEAWGPSGERFSAHIYGGEQV